MPKPLLRASFPCAFKSAFYVEGTSEWDADLKCDYDQRNPLRQFRLREAAAYLVSRKIVVIKVVVATTRKGHHLRVWLDRRVGPYTALRLQAMLGDDPYRHRFNTRRVRHRREGWNVLFSAKYHNGILTSHEQFDALWTDVATRIFGAIC
jgi:hypothetical protein